MNLITKTITIVSAIITLVGSECQAIEQHNSDNTNTAPKTPAIWNIDVIDAKVRRIKSGERFAFYDQIKRQADAILREESNPSVMNKVAAPISGDKHDYMSLSRYWWQNPNTEDGLPYVRHDGKTNPEINDYDRNSLSRLSSSVRVLSLAYYISGEQKYADKAISRLRTWFVDPSTRMNPNLNFAQVRKGHDNNRGNKSGVLDGYSFVEMLDAVSLLEIRGAIPQNICDSLHSWFGEFTDWMLTSEQGIAESRGRNNHAIGYDIQLTRYAIYGGRDSLARAVISSFPSRRLERQIMEDGRMPEELKRTIAFFYSRYNLEHMIDICDIARSLGIDDLYISANGAIDRAIMWLIPFAKDPSSFPYQQINSWDKAINDFARVVYRASKYNNTEEYKAIYNALKAPREESMFEFLYME
ncbi:MAG: alginate lyase family protein [Rikenellaceae bacterium]